MTIDIMITAGFVVLIAWQQYNIKNLQDDMDEIIGSHNDFVITMIDIFDEAERAKEYSNEQD